MAFAHAVWESPPEEAPRIARRWADTSGVRFDSVLTQQTPNVEQTRGAVAHLLASALENNTRVASRVTDYVAFLDRFGDDLDVRSFWLARFALARLAGGDPLGLARGRDRVLARLQAGLSLDRDVPRLLRVTQQANAGGAGTGTALDDMTARNRLLLHRPAALAGDAEESKQGEGEAPWDASGRPKKMP